MPEYEYNDGILGAIVLMGQINEGKSDLETYEIVNKIIKAMKEKKRTEWPDKRLRKMVNQFDDLSKKYFLQTLEDMSDALKEAYEIVKEKKTDE